MSLITQFLKCKNAQSLLELDDMDGLYRICPDVTSLTEFFIENNLPYLDYLSEIPHDSHYELNITKILIPNNIKAIRNSAFYDCRQLQEVVVGSGTEVIEKYAFSGCHNLSKITFSEGLRTIRDFAFEECFDLTELDIPSSVKFVESEAFYNCSSLHIIRYKGKEYTVNEFLGLFN